MDIIDVAQRRQQEEIEHALQAHADKPVRTGREVCATPGCDEPISAARQALGAQLCIDCQRDAEWSAQRCARTGH